MEGLPHPSTQVALGDKGRGVSEMEDRGGK